MESVKRIEVISLIDSLCKGTALDSFGYEEGEKELSRLIAYLESVTGCPHIGDYIYYDDLPPEAIFEKALDYRPIVLGPDDLAEGRSR